MTRMRIIVVVVFFLVFSPFIVRAPLFARGDDDFVITLPVGRGWNFTITGDPTDDFYNGPRINISRDHHPVLKKRDRFNGLYGIERRNMPID